MAQRKKKGGLGRGISALIPGPEISRAGEHRPADLFFEGAPVSAVKAGSAVGEPVVANGAADSPAEQELSAIPGLQLVQVAPDQVVPNSQQPRKEFEPEALAELVHSVREFGVMQPIVVRRLAADQYELIMGERRLRASKLAGLESIPALVRDTADEDMLRDALLENLHRSNLNPLEEASAYQQLMSDFGITQDALAQRLGRSRSLVANMLRLLKLPESVQQKVAAGVLSAGHARALLSLSSPEQMTQAAKQIVDRGLSVREAEALASSQKAKRSRPKAGGRLGQLDELAAKVEDRLNTSVRISLGRKKGQLVIDFATIADLNRILGEMGLKGLGR